MNALELFDLNQGQPLVVENPTQNLILLEDAIRNARIRAATRTAFKVLMGLTTVTLGLSIIATATPIDPLPFRFITLLVGTIFATIGIKRIGEAYQRVPALADL